MFQRVTTSNVEEVPKKSTIHKDIVGGQINLRGSKSSRRRFASTIINSRFKMLESLVS